MSSSSPLPPDESILLPRLLSGSDSDSDHLDSDSEYTPYSAVTSPAAGNGWFLSPRRGPLDTMQGNQNTFRAAELFESNQDRARRLLGGLEVVTREWLNTYKAMQEDSVESVLCVICLQTLLEGGSEDTDSMVNQLPCKHLFHTDCLAPWLATRTTCPTCRASLDPDYVATDPSLQDAASNILRLLEHGRWSTVLANGAPNHVRQ